MYIVRNLGILAKSMSKNTLTDPKGPNTHDYYSLHYPVTAQNPESNLPKSVFF